MAGVVSTVRDTRPVALGNFSRIVSGFSLGCINASILGGQKEISAGGPMGFSFVFLVFVGVQSFRGDVCGFYVFVVWLWRGCIRVAAVLLGCNIGGNGLLYGGTGLRWFG